MVASEAQRADLAASGLEPQGFAGAQGPLLAVQRLEIQRARGNGRQPARHRHVVGVIGDTRKGQLGHRNLRDDARMRDVTKGQVEIDRTSGRFEPDRARRDEVDRLWAGRAHEDRSVHADVEVEGRIHERQTVLARQIRPAEGDVCPRRWHDVGDVHRPLTPSVGDRRDADRLTTLVATVQHVCLCAGEVGQLDAGETRSAETLERDPLPENLLARELEAHMGRLDFELDSRLAHAREQQRADGEERSAEQCSDVPEPDRSTRVWLRLQVQEP